MNIFGAITVGVFGFASVTSARLADKLLPKFEAVPRGGLILLLSLLVGCAVTKLYLRWLDRKADVHASAKLNGIRNSEGTESTRAHDPPDEKR